MKKRYIGFLLGTTIFLSFGGQSASAEIYCLKNECEAPAPKCVLIGGKYWSCPY